METNSTGLLGPDGKEIKTIKIPTVKFRDFVFAIDMLKKEDIVIPKDGGVRPDDLIREYRARCTELEDRIQILTAILCTVIAEGRDAGKEFLDSIGAKVTDLNNKVLYEPSKAKA